MNRAHRAGVLAGLVVVFFITADASAIYNPATGSFLSRDPGPSRMTIATPRVARAPVNGGEFLPGDDYGDGMNLYQYARSAPAKYSDPSGLKVRGYWSLPPEGWVSVGEPFGCDYIVRIEIVLYGPRATQELAAKWAAAIEKYWPDTFTFRDTTTCGVCSVRFDAALTVNSDSNYWFTAGGDNNIYVSDDSSLRAYTNTAIDSASIYRGADPWDVAHETGHFMGLDDQYTDKNGPDAGWAGNIMAEPLGTADKRNVKEIVEDTAWSFHDRNRHCSYLCHRSDSPDFEVGAAEVDY